jgi:hypothetical protein
MDLMRAVVVLTPSESKRLIARAVAQMPEVQEALSSGRIIIGNGTTNAYVAEELLGKPVPKWRYAAGVVAGGQMAVTRGDERLEPFALKKGEVFPGGWIELLPEFERGDVFIKGGNAIDLEGNVGVLLANDLGGTVGRMLGVVAARGAYLIVPIGLEKLVPDVIEAARHCGIRRVDHTDGLPVGMAVLTDATVITEIESLELLAGVDAWHVASGGIDGSEGAVTLALEGPRAAVEQALAAVESVSGEPPVTQKT